MGRFHDLGICHLYYDALKQYKNIFVFLFVHSCWHLEIWTELYSQHYKDKSLFIPTLFTRYIVHPNIYSLGNTIHKNTTIEDPDIIQNIHTTFIIRTAYIYTSFNIHTIYITKYSSFVQALFIIRTANNSFLLSKFLPMEVSKWRPMSNVEYRMQHNHAAK